MRLVIALGGNALLQRGQPLTADNQRRNVRSAVRALAPIAAKHSLIITHGNGPQVGLLALQAAAFRQAAPYPLDLLDAETEGMIGYLIEQELINHLPNTHRCAAVLTQIIVDRDDPAFTRPDKPIGPVYDRDEALRLERQKGWVMAREGVHYRRVVPSPKPQRILELPVIELLVNHGVTVICAGGGGIPCVMGSDGEMIGADAVIDKDLASALLARQLGADALLLLTDVDAVYTDWQGNHPTAIRRAPADVIRAIPFAAGSMGPKVKAAVEFSMRCGCPAGIGRLSDAESILRGEAGTLIERDADRMECWNR